MKGNMKPKVVLLYAHIFDPKNASNVEENENFWHEFFLLTPHPVEFNQLIDTLPVVDNLKHGIYLIFSKCIDYMQEDKADNKFIQFYALQTCVMILQKVFSLKWSDFTTDVFNCLCGLMNAEKTFARLVQNVCAGCKSTDAQIVSASLDLIWTVISATSTLNMNGIISFFVNAPLLDGLLGLLEPGSAFQVGIYQQALINLSFLANYKRETKNLAALKVANISHETIFAFIFDLLAINDCGHLEDGQNVAGYQSWMQYILSTLSHPTTSTQAQILNKWPEDVCLKLMISLYTFLKLNPQFKTYWTKKAGLNSVAYYFLDQFSTGADSELLSCQVCLNILWLSIPYNDSSMVNVKRYGANRLSMSTFKRLTIDEFDSSNPLLSLTLLFIALNQRRPARDLIYLSLQIILKVLKVAKVNKKRFQFKWQWVYKSCIVCIKYVDDVTVRKCAIDVLDFILCYGDNFLNDTRSYDLLYYEVILNHEIFDKIDVDNLKNIKSITTGFMNKFSQEAQSPDQMFDCIHKYYEQVELDLKGNYPLKMETDGIDSCISKALSSSK